MEKVLPHRAATGGKLGGSDEDDEAVHDLDLTNVCPLFSGLYIPRTTLLFVFHAARLLLYNSNTLRLAVPLIFPSRLLVALFHPLSVCAPQIVPAEDIWVHY